MELRQTAQLLARASAIDNRIVNEVNITAWHELLAHLDYDDAVWALNTHRQTSTDYVTPAHLIGHLRARRTAAALHPAGPVECDIHVGYPLEGLTCAMCVRHPEDRDRYLETGEKPVMRRITDLGTIGRQLPSTEEAPA